jgi:hypothetical protein
VVESGFTQKDTGVIGNESNAKAVEEAQRLVIKGLYTKLNGLGSIFDN